MGLWIAFDVVTGTALACGGYAVALLVYVANRGHYHPLVRPALLTSAFGYTLGGLSVLVDIGRPWNFYRIPLFFWDWNFSSILLEVALCIMLYTVVLWVEVSPAILEGWRHSELSTLRRLSARLAPRLERALPYLIALGLLLPTMHQSSLGGLMLIAGPKLHPLWHTPFLPMLFLVSCVSMGYAAVVLESVISARVFHRPTEAPMLRALATPIATVLLTYVAIRLTDLAANHKLGLVDPTDPYGLLFLAEIALFLIPAAALLLQKRHGRVRALATTAVLVVLGGGLYRFSTFLFAYDPGPAWSYFPTLGEFAVTLGFISAEILGYVVVVKRFPILRGLPEEARRVAPSPSPTPRIPVLVTAAATAPRFTDGFEDPTAGEPTPSEEAIHVLA
jgi:Ni/Fe-hydrogenase subunit HybB-like protein